MTEICCFVLFSDSCAADQYCTEVRQYSNDTKYLGWPWREIYS